jgi:catalase
MQDGVQFVDLVHSGKPAPQCGFPQAQTAHHSFWDWVSLTPDSVFMSIFALSDYTIPRSYRKLKGFGVNTFVLVNKVRLLFLFSLFSSFLLPLSFLPVPFPVALFTP